MNRVLTRIEEVLFMSWIKLRTKNGVLKLKPRWQMRYEERIRQVPVVDLGLVVITWWPHQKSGPLPASSVGSPAQTSLAKALSQEPIHTKAGPAVSDAD